MRRPAAIAAIALVPLIGSGFLLQSRPQRDGARLLDQVLGLVHQRFVDSVETGALYEKAARGLVTQLNDPYTELFSPKQLQAFQTTTGGRYGGVGMQIENQQGHITVSTVFPNTPAEQAGLRVGDRIVKVDTASTQGWSISQVSDKLTGTPGTKVTATFQRPGVGAPITLTFTRATIHIPAVPYAITMGDRIGYLPLQRFNETAADEVESGIRKLVQQGVRGIVLDLRGNPGGILDQGLEISNMFLKKGQEIASVRGRQGAEQRYRAQGEPVLPSMPIVVLTDEYAASAAEIVAGSLQDHDRALVVGQTTFGKGLVQTVFPLEGGYALKMTTAKWFTPVGRSIQKERKFENGRFVEEAEPDTVPESDSARKKRPTYKSTGGRVVYGGGGITPDVIIDDDTLLTAEQQLSKALAPKSQDVYVTLGDYALELSRSAPTSFTVQPAWRDELYTRLARKGVTIDRATWTDAERYVDRLLEQRIARFAYGDSTAKRRDLRFDAPLRRAIDLLKAAPTQQQLFIAAKQPTPKGTDAATAASAPRPVAPSAAPPRRP